MKPTHVRRWAAVARLLLVATAVPLLAAATGRSLGEERSAAAWKINTHLFAANVALADAINDGKVTIPPFGEFAVPPDVVQALRAAPAAYRAGVLAPDLFPDMYVGGWVIHSDLSDEKDGWMADNWLRHVWTHARGWPNDADRNRVLAFGYGFLTHGAGDIFAHTWVNQKANGAWVSFQNKDRETAIKHIVLEGFVGEHTPATDLSLDVWPRFVSNTLIKDAVARRHHKPIAVHYQRWLAIADGLPKAIARAKSHMNENINNDAPYWMKCAAHPVWCGRKEHAETWLLDINRGFRALVDSSESLGEMLMDGSSLDGVGTMTGWATEWVPKMFGAHALGEGAAALSQFMQWAGDVVPISDSIKAAVERFVHDSMPRIWQIYQAAQKPSTYMEPVLFPSGTKDKLRREMGVQPGRSTFDWRAFEPIYNTIVLSKLVLLDAAGLNELTRRAGVTAQVFPDASSTNVMLGVFRSMTQSYQWVGDSVKATTQFGICGPETGELLLLHAVCGIEHRDYTGRNSLTRSSGGFALWGHPEAREKVFGMIFKGYGPGPGTSDRQIVAYAPAAVAGLRDGRRALRVASEQIATMRDIVAVMQDKVAGVVTAAPNTAPATTPAPGARPTGARPTGARPTGAAPTRTPTAGSLSVIADWGTRCCSKDIVAMRAALTALQSSGGRLQNPAVLAQLGRRPSATQTGQRASQIIAALDAFANSRDAASAGSALTVVVRQIDALAAVVAGNQ